MVQLLLQSGASPVLESTACYPTTVRQMAAPGGGPHPLQAARRLKPRYPPTQSALMHDQLEVLRLLLDHPSSCDTINNEMLFIDSCKHSAVKCVRFLASSMPDTMNSRALPSRKTALYYVSSGFQNSVAWKPQKFLGHAKLRLFMICSFCLVQTTSASVKWLLMGVYSVWTCNWTLLAAENPSCTSCTDTLMSLPNPCSSQPNC